MSVNFTIDWTVVAFKVSVASGYQLGSKGFTTTASRAKTFGNAKLRLECNSLASEAKHEEEDEIEEEENEEEEARYIVSEYIVFILVMIQTLYKNSFLASQPYFELVKECKSLEIFGGTNNRGKRV